MSKLAVTLTTLCLLAGPVLADPAPAAKPTPAAVDKSSPARHAASSAELDQYAAREQAAKKLEAFQGGRGRGGTVATGTVIIILLVVIIVLLVL